MNYSLSSFYHSKTWEKFRSSYLAERLLKDGDLIDDETGEVIADQAKAILHHKTPLTLQNVNDPEISLNPENIELVSLETHNKIHEKFKRYKREIFITRDDETAEKKEADLIVSFERIKSALGGNDFITSNAWAVYFSLIDGVKTRLGKWRRAVVVCKMRDMEFERLKKTLGAEEIK